MKLISIAILLTLLSGTAFAKSSVGHLDYKYKVAATSKFFRNLSAEELAAAFSLWAKTALKGKISDDNLHTHVFDDHASLKKLVKTREYTCYVMSPEDLDPEIIFPKEVLIPLRDGKKFTQYIVLVNKDRPIKELSDLKDKEVIFYDGPSMHLAQIWLEHVLNSNAEIDPGLMPLNLVDTKKPMDGIYKVFFGQSDAVVVTLQTFKTACLLNPQLEQKLGILLQSPNLIPLAFFFDPRVEDQSRIFLRDSLLEMHQTPGGNQVLTIFQCTKMELHPVTILNDTLAFLREAGIMR